MNSKLRTSNGCYPSALCAPQDLHLAKRYYDKSLGAQKDAHVPVRLALASLAVHAW